MKLILKETKEKRSKEVKNVNAPNCPIIALSYGVCPLAHQVCLPTCAPQNPKRLFAYLRGAQVGKHTSTEFLGLGIFLGNSLRLAKIKPPPPWGGGSRETFVRCKKTVTICEILRFFPVYFS